MVKARKARKTKRTKSKKTGIVKPKRKGKDHFEKIALERKKTSNLAFILALAAIFLLFAFGFLVIVYIDVVMPALIKAYPSITLTASDLSTYGIIWLVLGCLLSVVNFRIRRRADRSWMRFLLILGILAILVGRPLVGLLITAASIIYLTNDSRLRKMMGTKT